MRQPPLIDVDADKVPDFIREHHYSFDSEGDTAFIFKKVVRASATMQTPFGVLRVLTGATDLFIRKDKHDDTFRFGIAKGSEFDVSAPFLEGEFQDKLEEFERKLNNGAAV